MNKMLAVVVTVISFALGGCVSLPGVARGYAPPRDAPEQLAQIDAQLQSRCTQEAQIANTVIGAVVGVAAGALLGGDGGRRGYGGGSRVPNAVLGGLAGGAIATSITSMNCQQLWQYRQTIQAGINRHEAARQATSICNEVVRNGTSDIVCHSTTGIREGWRNYPPQ